MKVAFVKPALFNVPVLNTYKKQTFCGGTANMQNDVFIKNQNVSFGSRKFDDLCNSVRKDICDYMLDSEEITCDGIGKIVKQYCPDVSVEEFEQKEHQIHQGAAFGYTIGSIPDEDCGFLLACTKKRMKVNLPENNSLKDRLKSAKETVHEITHAIQQDCDDRISETDFYNNYFRTEKDKTKAVNTFYATQPICDAINFDIVVLESIITPGPWEFSDFCGTNAQDGLYEKVNQRFMDKFGNGIEEEFKKRILDGIEQYEQSHDSDFNKQFILEYIAHFSSDEKDAYMQEYLVNPNYYSKQRILFYKTIETVAKNLSSKCNE